MAPERIHVGGNKYIDKQMYAVLKTVSTMVGFDVIAMIVQGSWNNTVEASGNTHKGAGAVDVSGSETQLKAIVSAFRRVAAGYGTGWVRYPNGKWKLHAHLILVVDGCDPSIIQQFKAYQRGENGLGGGKDNGPRDWASATGSDVPILTDTPNSAPITSTNPLDLLGKIEAGLSDPTLPKRALLMTLGAVIMVIAIVRLVGMTKHISIGNLGK